MRFSPLIPFRSNVPSRAGNGPFSDLRSEMDDLFARFFELDTTGRFSGLADFAPSIDVSESESQIIVKADLPGVEKDNISLELKEDVLVLKGERSDESESGQGEDRRVIERSYGRFERSMRLPFTPAESEIDTSYKNGVLTVTVAKPQKPEDKAKQIPIRGKWV